VAVDRGLAVRFEGVEPGRCAVTEFAQDSDDRDGMTYGPGGNALQVLGRARVVLDCDKPGTRPYLNAVVCDWHHARLSTRSRGEGGEALS
jgi:hypothetical protein